MTRVNTTPVSELTTLSRVELAAVVVIGRLALHIEIHKCDTQLIVLLSTSLQRHQAAQYITSSKPDRLRQHRPVVFQIFCCCHGML